ncbi:MAG: enoyl-CoA hydratase/isomerase family protein [Sciscionella sp.]
MTRQLSSAVHLQLDGPIAMITVGTGKRRNALNREDWQDLRTQLDELAGDLSVRAVVIQGAGGTFCAGSDMTEWVGADAEQIEESFARMEAAFRAVERSPVPVVAVIRGDAAGAGCQLALACDIRVMADTARIGMPIARLGILPSPAFAARMLRLAGAELTGEMLYTGRSLDARRAVSIGLASSRIAEQDLDSHLTQLLADIARQPAVAIRAAKRALRVATGEPPQQRIGPAVDHATFQRGINNFLGTTRAPTT